MSSSANAFTIGIDFGTNSVRAIVVSCADGGVVGSSVFDYPSGDQGVLLEPGEVHLARQNPYDYVLGLRESVNGALADAARYGLPDRGGPRADRGSVGRVLR